MEVRLEHLTKIFPSRDKKGSEVVAVNDFDFTIPEGKLIGLLGPSGCGKSTVLYMICGLEKPTSGKIYFGEDDVTDVPSEKRGVGLVFQNYALYPHLTVRQNITFPLENLKGEEKLTKEQRNQKALEAAKLVQIEGLMDRKPGEMSGGQQQRVAIARALANDPRILLCDEATSALDPKTTDEVLTLLKKINETHGITIVIITHSMSVVQEICNRVAIIDKGEVAEVGNVIDVFNNPQSDAAMRLVLSSGSGEIPEMKGNHLVRIVFTENSSYEPVVANMVLKFSSPVNIMFANTRDIGGIAQGQMVLQLPSDESLRNQMIQYLKDRRLEVQELSSMKEFEEVNI